MLPSEVDAEIERLKVKKVELTSKLNLVEEFEEKEQLESEIAKIQQQIEILEKLKSKL
jgi:hypothetical protein